MYTINDMSQWKATFLNVTMQRNTMYQSLPSSGDVTIPSGMTLTADSDLNGDSPQFTFTCTSTGGPATIVTWTRDSETLSGGITVLNDPVTAQYTHTLTVTERLRGQYRCTVSNSISSSNSPILSVQGCACMTYKTHCYIAFSICVLFSGISTH